MLNLNSMDTTWHRKLYQEYEESFQGLMQKRIHKVLIICSHYDAFLLEEDGRIEEQIFNEYVSLNLRYPPSFIHVSTASEALEVLRNETINLVIEMLSISDVEPFRLSKILKDKYPEIPLVILTPFSREVSLKLENEDLSAIDYVFCWLGNADLLLAIIKLIEDAMNVSHDVESAGVQNILLVEDSIRYVSSYLPVLYKIILNQSRDFSSEALNAHQSMLRMRGRPKILLATDYQKAMAVFNRFPGNFIGVISDVNYKISPAQRDTKSNAGIQLCKMVKAFDPNIPVLLQSSNLENKNVANRVGAGFLYKYSKNLSHELRTYVTHHFAFGPFRFIDPDTGKEHGIVNNLKTLQEQLPNIPENVMAYHARRDDFSKWLNARALFPVARILKQVKHEHFANTEGLKEYIQKVISEFRTIKGHGIIADFNTAAYDQFTTFARIGQGYLGGKARGLAFLDQMIKKHNLGNKYDGINLTIPKTVVISTDYFDAFMEQNNLFDALHEGLSDEEVLALFLDAELPVQLCTALQHYLQYVSRPIAVRSSSKLEDSYYQPFAGIYKTYMVPFAEDKTEVWLHQAIKCIYASVYFQAGRQYIKATSNVIDEEKMGVVLQEVIGKDMGQMYCPTISGVARSVNFYPVKPEKAEEGIVQMAYGLGKYIVDGGMALRFSPARPKNILQLSAPDMALRETQTHFLALDLRPGAFQPSIDDSVNLLKKRVGQISSEPALKFIASSYDATDNVLRDGYTENQKLLITYAGLLNQRNMPFAKMLNDILQLSQQELNNPVELEFACEIDSIKPLHITFHILQIRPVVINKDIDISVNTGFISENTVLYAESALGHGRTENLKDIVYIPPEAMQQSSGKNMVQAIDTINKQLIEQGREYILIGPGRWGSSDPYLGIPVKWENISSARAIAEVNNQYFNVEPSQGTHFFQNLTAFGIKYITINQGSGRAMLNTNILNRMSPCNVYDSVLHYYVSDGLTLIVNGMDGNAILNLK